MESSRHSGYHNIHDPGFRLDAAGHLRMHSTIRNEQSGETASSLRLVLTLIALLWVLSDIGFYFLLPALGQAASYNENPIGTSLYYVFWVGIAVITFWPQYARWQRVSRWRMFGNRLTSIAVWSLAFIAAMAFLAYLPKLPPIDLQGVTFREGFTLPELPLANGWYFLPKSVEILFQQLLVVALVLAMASEGIRVGKIALYCGLLFGGTHLLLAFGDVPVGYVIRFAFLAGLFGLTIPYLILRVPNGFAYSYAIHWGYYAATVMMAQIVGPEAVLTIIRSLFDLS